MCQNLIGAMERENGHHRRLEVHGWDVEGLVAVWNMMAKANQI